MMASVPLPIRLRVTAAFALVMSLLLAALSLALYWSISSALLDELDTGLRFRAAALGSISSVVETAHPSLEEPGEAFDQLITADHTVVRSSPGIPAAPLVTPHELSQVRGPTFFQRRVPGVVGTARLLVLRLPGPSHSDYLIVGASMTDRHDALRQLSIVCAVGLPLSIAVACFAGWVMAGLALRAVERMRLEVSAITASGLDRRLALPRVRDEIYRLGQTLNDLLERLDLGQRRDRLFLAQASHELRTPLASLKAELDLARSRPRTTEELAAALESVSEEADRLVRLSNDLLAQARTDRGRLPVRRENLPLSALVDASLSSFRPRALSRGVTLTAQTPVREVNLDPMRFRQALDNVVDNALRHTPAGGTVSIVTTEVDSAVVVAVLDSGPGFCDPVAEQGRLDDPDGDQGVRFGLGLRIARTIAISHGGGLHIANRALGGAEVSLTIADVSPGLRAGPAIASITATGASEEGKGLVKRRR
jgi:two-component system OmpR family sensor kinase